MPARSIERIRHAPRVRALEVRRVARTGPRYQLITLAGGDLADFETPSPTDHVGIIPPGPDSGLSLPHVEGGRLRWPTPRPPMREYTVRRFDPASGELDVRVLLHAGAGPVSGWAAAAAPGDRVGVVGPLSSELMPDGYPNYLLAGDLTAVPAIARWLGVLPEGSSAQVLIAAGSEDDVIELHCAQPISVRWLTEGGRPEADQLPHALRELEPYAVDTWAWAAGEALAMREARRLLLDKPGLTGRPVSSGSPGLSSGAGPRLAHGQGLAGGPGPGVDGIRLQLAQRDWSASGRPPSVSRRMGWAQWSSMTSSSLPAALRTCALEPWQHAEPASDRGRRQ